MQDEIIKKFGNFKKYKVEIILITVALLITFISLLIYLASTTNSSDEIVLEENYKTDDTLKSDFYVDISGAVNNPGVYKFNNGDRIENAIKKAGGLSQKADFDYFYRNYNLAAFIYDQEKIYVPYLWEIRAGIFVENTRILNYLSLTPQNESITKSAENEKININSADIDELDQLPGIGAVTAQKIIQNRPYTTIDDLLSKKVVSKSVFENIKNDISAN